MAAKLALQHRQAVGRDGEPGPRDLHLSALKLVQSEVHGQRRRGGGLRHVMQHGAKHVGRAQPPPAVAGAGGKPTKT